MISALLSFLFPVRCIGCGAPNASICARCIALSRKSLAMPHPYIISTFDFKDPLIRKAIHAIKYYGRRDIIKPLAEKLAEDIARTDYAGAILVPVPMPRFRRFMRGFNQSESIALEVGRLLNLPVRSDIVRRIQAGLRQATIKHRKDRLHNQEGNFEATTEALGGTFIVIDDVTTTGATLNEVRKALLAKKAHSVVAATLAH